ncbi:MAG: hypothetical protein LUF91_08365, partial [Oscillospiraceae bacterium]|nr:hypothetical protein [Oscillospiraceae bacterium]
VAQMLMRTWLKYSLTFTQTGITRMNGGNRTVSELKENYELKKENERLRSEIDHLRNRNYERT